MARYICDKASVAVDGIKLERGGSSGAGEPFWNRVIPPHLEPAPHCDSAGWAMRPIWRPRRCWPNTNRRLLAATSAPGGNSERPRWAGIDGSMAGAEQRLGLALKPWIGSGSMRHDGEHAPIAACAPSPSPSDRDDRARQPGPIFPGGGLLLGSRPVCGAPAFLVGGIVRLVDQPLRAGSEPPACPSLGWWSDPCSWSPAPG